MDQSQNANRPQGRYALYLVFALSLALGFFATGCGGQADQNQSQAQTQTAGKRYHLAGTIMSIDKEQGHLIVNHGDIPGFMSAMTMPYPVADPKTLDQVSVGDQITADVVVSDGGARLENVVVVKKGTGAPATGPSGANLKPGSDGAETPDFALVNQDGKRVHLDQYRGKAVLLTFIYTRCPLPDYCPLMTHNFAEIEKGLAKNPDVYAKTHLLSISFDPKYDTPEVLRKYASAFVDEQKKAPFEHWEFTSILEPERADIARYFNLFYNQTDGQITHSLSTNIIAPDGHVYRSYYDNDWKPSDVLSDLVAAAGNSSQERSAVSPAVKRS